MHFTVVLYFLHLTVSLAAPSPQSDASTTASSPTAQSTACGFIIDATDLGENIFLAKDVYDCFISVPFNAAVATRFIRYYNDTLQFQSTLAYLKNPPASYQQPATDLIAGLEQIQSDIDGGFFGNQYAFEATLQNLIYSSHDAHLQLYSGILATFAFGSPYRLVSVSVDGLQIPKVYIADDLLEAQAENISWEPSALTMINGQNVEEYLSQFAAVNAFGYLDPNAEWNRLMYNPALDIQGFFSVFDGFTTFYPGENLTFTFENGTELRSVPWLATYYSQGPTGPLSTGGDFYNSFVLGLYPASFDTTSLTATSSATATPSATSSIIPTATSWNNPAYPSHPDVVQPDLSLIGGGLLTGYFLNDTLIGVLSIPSFTAFGDAVRTFSDTVSQFLQRSKEAGMEKIVIDVQQNAGGDALLAYDVFKQFFPSIDPFGGSRLRAHPAADVLGNTITKYYNTRPTEPNVYEVLSADEWVATDRLNAETGQNFSSWGEFFGPHADNGDYFTTTQRYNLSSPIFDVVASGGILVHGYGNLSRTASQPYAAQDIIILTDALCSSACAIFMEMMHHNAGVRTVVVGGQPSNGPMQAPSGSRGAAYYTSDIIDANINYAEYINLTTKDLLPTRTDNDFFILSLGLNLRDQIRQGENIPLQFVYEATNCRIFYTPQTVFNFTNLWNYAASAIWSNPELCVQGSTNFTMSNATYTTGPSNGSMSINANVLYDISGVLRVGGDANGFNDYVGGSVFDSTSPRKTSSGESTSTSMYNKNVPKQYQRKQTFNGLNDPASPYSGGTNTAPRNPQSSLAPLPVQASGEQGRIQVLGGGSVAAFVKAGLGRWT